MRKIHTGILAILFLLLFLTLPYADTTEIRILHVNDFHGFAEPHKPPGSDKAVGGIAYLSGKVEKLRKEKSSLLLAAGDMIRGDNWADLFEGRSVIEWMNLMDFDVMVVGNHEFDFGQQVLRKRISESRFPLLGANVEGLGELRSYVVKEVKGIRIAVIGVVTEETPITTHPRNVVGLKFISPAKTVERYLRELKNRADIFIVLSHIGYPADRTLAENVKGIDVIVGGHSHTKIEKPVTVGKTIIVQAWEHGKALGVLDLTIEDGKMIGFRGHLEEIIPEKGTEDKAVQALVEKYQKKVDALLGGRVGKALVDLNGQAVREKETNLGDLVSDVMRRASGADVAITNGGGIRTGIRKGEIKLKDIYAVLPFDNYIVAFRLTGKELSDALEHGLSAVGGEEGRFPQVSGLTLTYSRSAEKGARIKEILVAGKPIDPNREYVVATNDFLAVGGDGYEVFKNALKASGDFSAAGEIMKGGKVVYSDPGHWLRDLVVQSIKEQGSIAPAVEGRIKELP